MFYEVEILNFLNTSLNAAVQSVSRNVNNNEWTLSTNNETFQFDHIVCFIAVFFVLKKRFKPIFFYFFQRYLQHQQILQRKY